MKTIIRYRWAVIVLWIAMIAAFMLLAPNLGELVQEKGQLSVPEGYSSSIAQDILNETAQKEGTSPHYSFALVLYDEQARVEQLQADALLTVELLRAEQERLGVAEIMSAADMPELAAKTVAADGTTILIPFEVKIGDIPLSELREELASTLSPLQSEHYLTGSGLIEEDVMINSQEGVKRTEYITVAIILVILLIVFRSVLAPFVPLVTIGISYLAAQSVVAFLADWWDFPLSTFTQMFMVAVMFGIGTDYCILLISRFKEELGAGKDTASAIVTTYQTAGKTVVYAAIAVMVGFASIVFSQFGLYQSAVAVAVGVLVLMIALLTIVPFFMAVLGRKLFWPYRGKLEHPESKVWAFAGNFSLKRPVVTLLLLAVVIVPFILSYNGALTYNTMDEIGDSYESVKGFNIIAEKFGPGETMPTQVVLKADRALAEQTDLQVIEHVSQTLADLEGVAYVRSMTRPMGEPMAPVDPALLTPDQQAMLMQQMAMVQETYMSKDLTVTTLDVVFEGNPYETASLDLAEEVERVVKDTLVGTPLESATLGVGGVSSMNADLREVSDSDYDRTLLLMIIGIALILVILLRSVIMPIYLIASLFLTYYMTMSVTEFLFVNLFDYTGLSWAVPFFAFVILIALGVDYSIFLMGRFNEHRTLSPADAILHAMKNMGTVIFSAAIILAGTFAAMLPAGVLSILQIATIVIIGLFLYALVFLPFFVPVMVKLFGRWNRWPFGHKS